MVRFEKDRYVIDVYTGADPVENWLELHKEIVYLISLVDQTNAPADGLCYLPQLLGDMMPEWEVARKMTDN